MVAVLSPFDLCEDSCGRFVVGVFWVESADEDIGVYESRREGSPRRDDLVDKFRVGASHV